MSANVMIVHIQQLYLFLHQEGGCTLMDHNLHFEQYYNINRGNEEKHVVRDRDAISYWMTDAVYMPGCHKMAVATSGRDIRFIDATHSHFQEEFTLYSLPHVPTCMQYHELDDEQVANAIVTYQHDVIATISQCFDHGAALALHHVVKSTKLHEILFSDCESRSVKLA